MTPGATVQGEVYVRTGAAKRKTSEERRPSRLFRLSCRGFGHEADMPARELVHEHGPAQQGARTNGDVPLRSRDVRDDGRESSQS
jgi:hypothetical protein